ncbi:MAG: CvpA family protein [Ruminococcaceae bacterium]|nr:CvpA family protein [Oscillospiraceae bacterium]
MSWTLDIIIVLIAGLTIYFAAKNGFVKTAISASAFIIAIALTAAFATPLAEVIKQTPVGDSIRTATEEKISDILLDGSFDIDNLLDGKSEEFNNLLSLAGIDSENLNDWYEDKVVSGMEEATARLAEKIAEPIIHTIAMAVAIVAIYIGTRIILMIVAFILDQIFRLPVLNACNKLLGIVVGVVLAAIRVLLFCFIANLIIANADFLGSDFISNLAPEKTLLFKFFNEIDIFSFFM